MPVLTYYYILFKSFVLLLNINTGLFVFVLQDFSSSVLANG
mgnify:CR=1 FL=1